MEMAPLAENFNQQNSFPTKKWSIFSISLARLLGRVRNCHLGPRGYRNKGLFYYYYLNNPPVLKYTIFVFYFVCVLFCFVHQGKFSFSCMGWPTLFVSPSNKIVLMSRLPSFSFHQLF